MLSRSFENNEGGLVACAAPKSNIYEVNFVDIYLKDEYITEKLMPI